MFEIPAEFQEKMKNAMKDESGVKLPFAAPVMWWMNGKTALKSVAQVTDATRFGGWGISKEEVDGFGSELPEVPTYWQLHEELTNGQGSSYAAYLCRTAWVAPIARRSAWFEYDGKSRSKLHVLCYLATYQQDKPLTPFGPVVLSASSLTGLDLDKCFKDFAAKSASVRGNTSPNFFFHPIGTWGKEPKFTERKSKNGGSSSSVTPPQLFLPEAGITTETLQKWFVGHDVAKEMASYLDLAQDWINDWKNRKGEQKQAATGFEEPPMITEEEYPF
jgi:hypothetical protein